MTLIAASLALLVGLSLGLLGGGGSILMVPMLAYALGLSPKAAIATSLLAVGVTSAVALVPHVRHGRVRWRTGASFGVAAMAGAYLGGRAAARVPGEVLLLLFAAMMLVTALAMLRGRQDAAPVAPRELALEKALPIGLLVGALSGLVGAGGGFLIVPALVLLGGLPMDAAIGTSLLVIAMQCLAGFAGYLGHEPVRASLAVWITTAAAIGALLGGHLVAWLPQARLRQIFAWFVLGMAIFVIGRQLPAGVRAAALYQALFVHRWPWPVAGAAIGGFVMLLLWRENTLLGVSTGYAEVWGLADAQVRKSWRPPFLLGIVLGGVVAGMLAGTGVTLAMGRLDALAGGRPLAKVALLFFSGVLMGFGAREAGGCTSGHGIVGVAQGARASLVATALFLATGFLVTHLLWRTHG